MPANDSTHVVVPVEEFTPQVVEQLKDYMRHCGATGVLVGALEGSYSWDLKPVVLDRGVLYILRVSDPDASTADLAPILDAFSAASTSVQFGSFADHLWMRRPFCQSTMMGASDEGSASLLQGVTSQLIEFHTLGLFHGNVVEGNIIIEGNRSWLVDYGFSFISSRAGEELGEGLVLEGQRADCIGLMTCLKSHLSDEISLAKLEELEAKLADSPSLDFLDTVRSYLDSLLEPQSAASVTKGELESVSPPAGKLISVPSEPEENSSDEDVSSEEAKEAPAEVSHVAEPDSDIPDSPVDVVADTHEPEGTDLDPIVEEEVAEEEASETANEVAEDPEVAEVEVAEVESKPSARSVTRRSAEETLEWLTGTGSIRNEVREVIRKAVLESDAMDDVAIRGSVSATAVDWSKFKFPSWAPALAFALAFIFAVFLYKNEPSGPTVDFKAYWESNIPSMMRDVAVRAVENDDRIAQATIIKDAHEGQVRPNVNSEFVKVAFNPKWESSLSAMDRRTALKFALAGLQAEFSGRSVDMQRVHPGVLLAVMDSMRISDDAAPLRGISLDRMQRLPGHIGNAFKQLSSTGATDCSEPAARALAKVLSGRLDAGILAAYFRGAPPTQQLSSEQMSQRLFYLMLLAAHYPDIPGVLVTFTSSSEVFRPFWSWFHIKGSDHLVNWSSVSDISKVALLSGQLPTQTLEFQYFADLLKFPITSVAKKSLIKMLEFYPDALRRETIKAIATSQFTRKQSILVLKSIDSEAEERHAAVLHWLQSNPGIDSILNVVIARKQAPLPDVLSIESARHLAKAKWLLSTEKAKSLIDHSEPLVRALAYSKLNTRDSEHRKILEEAFAKESSASVRKQLRLILDGDESYVDVAPF